MAGFIVHKRVGVTEDGVSPGAIGNQVNAGVTDSGGLDFNASV
jgi:hypothetical protein